MTRPVVRAIGLGLVPTLGLVAAIVLVPARAELAVHVWLLLVVAIALVTAIVALRNAYPDVPSSFDAGSRGGDSEHARLEGLERAEREVALSMSSEFDAHLRLRPALQEIASGLLASRRGVNLERRSARARELLGDETWALVRPDSLPPQRRHGGGIEPARLDRVLTSLEQL